MSRRPERSAVGAVLLIGIGCALLVSEWLPGAAGPAITGVIGVVFLGAFATTRRYGFLVPGMILSGIAAGLAAEAARQSVNGSAIVLGLGAGFLGIYVAARVAGVRAHWWPLIPGGILALIGGSLAVGGPEATIYVGRLWPLALIVAGLLALLRARDEGGPVPH